MTDYLVTEGMVLKAQPDNYEGYEGPHTASLQLQKRSSASVLSEEEAALCTLYDLPIATETVVVSQPVEPWASFAAPKVAGGAGLSSPKPVPTRFDGPTGHA